jgi:hypothetical protein
MRYRFPVLFVLLAAWLQAADLPSFDFNSRALGFPPLKLGDLLNKPPALGFSSPLLRATPEHLRPTIPSRPAPKMRILKPRDDIDFKMIIREPDPAIDPRIALVPPQPPGNLGGGK